MKTESIEEFIEKNYDAIDKFAVKTVISLRNVETTKGIQGVVEYAQQLLDHINEGSGLNAAIKCSKSCSFCCYDEIGMSNLEASYLYSVIKHFDKPLNKEHIDRQNNRKFHKLKYADKRCGLLDENGLCSIYEHRPLICRYHNSAIEPSHCDSKNGVLNNKPLRTIEGFGVIMALNKMDQANGDRDVIRLQHVLKKITDETI